MDTYRYTARNQRGEEVAGEIDAATADEAIARLLTQDLAEVRIVARVGEESDLSQTPSPLSTADAGEFATHVARVTTAGVPLAEGLRAAAEETGQLRVRESLRAVADHVDQGRSLEDALAGAGDLLPPHVAGLILAAARTDTMGEALMELVELQQSAQEVRRVIADAFWYPTVVLVLALAVLLFIGGFVVQSFGEMMREFELSLPLMTRLVLWWGDTGIWLFGVAVLLVVILAVGFRIMAESAGWHRLLGTMPLLGAVWQAAGIAQWMGLLRVLLKYGMTLPEALRLAGHGASNPAVADCSRRLADGVVRGRLLSQMMLTLPALPATLIPLVQWGEQSGALGESFQLGQQMFEERARIRAAMIQAVLPPLLFIFIGCMVIFVVIALFMPMVDLISKLS